MQEQTEGLATPRPWQYGPSVMVNNEKGEFCGYDVVDVDTETLICTCEKEHDAALITRSANKHDALLAVAEAARLSADVIEALISDTPSLKTFYQDALNKQRSALAALDKVGG